MKIKLRRTLAIMISVLSLLALASCKKKPANTATLAAILGSIYEDDGLTSIYRKDKTHFTKNVAATYGMSAADAQNFVDAKGNWGIYVLRVTINNREDTTYTFSSFDAGDFKADGIWLSKESNNGEISIPGSVTGEQFPATVIVNLDKVDTIQLYTAVASMKLNVVYFPTPADDNDEPAADSYKKLAVDNKITAPSDNGVDATTEIDAKRASVTDGSAFLAAYRNSDIAFSNESKLYGMNSETAARVVEKSGKWKGYVLNIDVQNKADFDLTVYSVNAENNGVNGVWICSVSQYGEFGLPAGEKQALPVTVLVDPDATGGKSVEEIIKAMKISLTYAPTPEVDSFGVESVPITKNIDVK